MQAIESQDLKRQCSEHWNRERGSVSAGSASDVDKFTDGSTTASLSDPTEHWNRERGSVSAGSASDVDKFTDGSTTASLSDPTTKDFCVNSIKPDGDNLLGEGSRHSFQEMKAMLQGFMKKASPDKLSTMHELFISNMQSVQCREMFLKLIEEMQKNL
ncbi:hypothetical protein L6164_037388 [Bauhinia variegata]|uniref:Uncharacterized protein n=1 Tax=Bauhinia variegata TaxID=167791 RepID=A0ACB9KK79_BAUVA|nr:hypothetical protein L6164_037388 [Bauhinia variegata]